MVEKFHQLMLLSLVHLARTFQQSVITKVCLARNPIYFYEAIRTIEEMRDATNGQYPTLAIWKNVIGSFSLNVRIDFKTVLESFTKNTISIPLTNGHMQERYEGEALISAGESLMLNIGATKKADLSRSRF